MIRTYTKFHKTPLSVILTSILFVCFLNQLSDHDTWIRIRFWNILCIFYLRSPCIIVILVIESYRLLSETYINSLLIERTNWNKICENGGFFRVLWFPINKTDRHDITEIMLKVGLSTINQTTNIGIIEQHLYISRLIENILKRFFNSNGKQMQMPLYLCTKSSSRNL